MSSAAWWCLATRHKETGQGESKGELIFDQRFGSTQKDTNIEYTVSPTRLVRAKAATSSAYASARRQLGVGQRHASTGGGGGGSVPTTVTSWRAVPVSSRAAIPSIRALRTRMVLVHLDR